MREKITGTKVNRPEVVRLKDKLRPGDIVVVESFSRLGRSTKNLIDLVIYFEEHEVKLISDKEILILLYPMEDLYLLHSKLLVNLKEI